MGVPAPRSRAPEFALESTAGGPVGLEQLRAGGPVLLVFAAEECPTSAWPCAAWRPLAGPLRDDGRRPGRRVRGPAPRSPPASPARTGFDGDRPVRAAALRHLARLRPRQRCRPRSSSTPDGTRGRPRRRLGRRRAGRPAGVAAGLRRAGAHAAGDEAPRQQARLRREVDATTPRRSRSTRPARRGGRARGHVRARLDRRAARRAADAASASTRCSAAATRRASLGPVPPGMGEATLERVAACAVLAGCRPDVLPGRASRRRGRARPGLQPQRPGGDDPPPGQLVVVNGPVRDAHRPQLGHGRARPRLAREPDHRPRAAPARHAHRRRPPGRPRPRDARPSRQARRLHRRGRGERARGSRCTSSAASPPGASTVTLIAADAPLSISDHRSTTPEQLARCLGWAAATPMEPELVAARRDLAVRRLPRARARCSPRRAGARPTSARGHLRGGAAPGAASCAASARRRPRRWPPTPTRPIHRGRAPRTSC